MYPRAFSKISPVNRSLIFLDWTFFLGWEMLSPILAVFIIREIGGSVAQAGYAVATALLTRALFQIPISLKLDKVAGERDDFWVLSASTVIAGFIALGYFFAQSIWAVYLLQFTQGIRGSLYAATWPAIFSRHLNHESVAFQWSLDTATLAIISGIAGAVGGYVANEFGFRSLFIVISILSFLSIIPLLGARELLRSSPKEK